MIAGECVVLEVPRCPTRYGRYEYTQRNGLVVVTLFSPRLRRYVHGMTTYHPDFVRPVGVTA